jgi:hypothetical protein
MPLYGRSYFGLVFLARGITESAGSGIRDNYPSGTNFVSNGQRNSTAEVRFDGTPLSAPEQGEGGNTNVYYTPSVEVIGEFTVENNSFSAEYGNNGGTVVNIMMKQDGNQLHGSAWYFGQGIHSTPTISSATRRASANLPTRTINTADWSAGQLRKTRISICSTMRDSGTSGPGK